MNENKFKRSAVYMKHQKLKLIFYSQNINTGIEYYSMW